MGQPVPTAPAVDPTEGSWEVNEMLMSEGLGGNCPSLQGSDTPLGVLGGQTPIRGCKRQLGGLQALIKQEA